MMTVNYSLYLDYLSTTLMYGNWLLPITAIGMPRNLLRLAIQNIMRFPGSRHVATISRESMLPAVSSSVLSELQAGCRESLEQLG